MMASAINNPILPTSKAVSSRRINTNMKPYKQANKDAKTPAVLRLLKCPFAYKEINDMVAAAAIR